MSSVNIASLWRNPNAPGPTWLDVGRPEQRPCVGCCGTQLAIQEARRRRDFLPCYENYLRGHDTVYISCLLPRQVDLQLTSAAVVFLDVAIHVHSLFVPLQTRNFMQLESLTQRPVVVRP